jgi:hypothetical protein
MKFTTYITIALIAATATFCVQPPDYPEAPELEYIGFNKLTISQGGGVGQSDTLVLRLGFTDGDGNLGFEDATFDVSIMDSRDSSEEVRKLPVIPEQGVGNGISGEIRLRFPNEPGNLCCIFPDVPAQIPCTPAPPELATDSFYYEVFIQDRDGNRSNIIQTETVTLLCR